MSRVFFVGFRTKVVKAGATLSVSLTTATAFLICLLFRLPGRGYIFFKDLPQIIPDLIGSHPD